MVGSRVTTMRTASLVVEHNVRPPDLVGRNPDELDAIELCWRPAQLVVIPNLGETKRRKNTQPHFGEVNHLFLSICIVLRKQALITGDAPRPPPAWE